MSFSAQLLQDEEREPISLAIPEEGIETEFRNRSTNAVGLLPNGFQERKLAVEYSTSKYRAYHGVEVERKMMGVVSCPRGRRLHSDLNGALNILRKAAGKTVSAIKKTLPSIVDQNRVTPEEGCNPRNLGETLALKGGRRSDGFPSLRI